MIFVIRLFPQSEENTLTIIPVTYHASMIKYTYIDLIIIFTDMYNEYSEVLQQLVRTAKHVFYV